MRCDSHVPIIGPTDRYPQVVDRTYLADVATLKQLESVSATRAIRRFVIVQPSFYGTDNSLLVERTSARTLSGMAEQGVRGLRLNLYSPLREKAPLADRFAAIAAKKCAPKTPTQNGVGSAAPGSISAGAGLGGDGAFSFRL